MQEHEVVDLADVILGAELVLGELVQCVEVHVCEELRRQIADWQAQVRGLRGEAFVLRYPVEQMGRTTHLVVFARVMHQDLFSECHPPGFGDLLGQLLAQNRFVDGDEEVGQVALQVEDWLRPVLTGAADLCLKPFCGIQRAAPWYAGTTSAMKLA